MGPPRASLRSLANGVWAGFTGKAVPGRNHPHDRCVQLSSSTAATGERGGIRASQALCSGRAECWISDSPGDGVSDGHFALNRSLQRERHIGAATEFGENSYPSGAKRRPFPSCRLTAVMRRLLSIQLIVILLAPWIAALSGAAVPLVPCPMHRSGGAASHAHPNGMTPEHQPGAEHSSRPHQGTTARGCNCAGECGRSGVPFAVLTSDTESVALLSTTELTSASGQLIFGSSARLLPPATGPPQRLRI